MAADILLRAQNYELNTNLKNKLYDAIISQSGSQKQGAENLQGADQSRDSFNRPHNQDIPLSPLCLPS